MRISISMLLRLVLLLSLLINLTIFSDRMRADTGTCGGANISLPFTDVMNSPFFCQIAAAFFSGLTNGTTATTYSPTEPVPREQMAALITRTLDQSLTRGSRRAALGQFWTPKDGAVLKRTTVGHNPRLPISDGTDIWVPSSNSGTISRVRASDGKLLETWTGASFPFAVIVAAGKIFAVGQVTPGILYSLDPSQPAGAVTTVTTALGSEPTSLAFDGLNIWTANQGPGLGTGSVSRVNLATGQVNTISTGFNRPVGMVYDGANIWVTDIGDFTIKKLNADGSIAMTVPLPNDPGDPKFPVFDGTNIWIPTAASKVYVVRAMGPLAGTILATLTGNGLNGPNQAAFDGERVLVTSVGGGGVVSLWKASDFTPLGFTITGGDSDPIGVCSDGLNFWITLSATHQLARF